MLQLGPQLFTSGLQVLQCLRAVLDFEAQRCSSISGASLTDVTADVSALDSDADSDADDSSSDSSGSLCAVVLGLLCALVEAGAERRAANEEAELRAALPALATLSSAHTRYVLMYLRECTLLSCLSHACSASVRALAKHV
jgi:hypothetical protein